MRDGATAQRIRMSPIAACRDAADTLQAAQDGPGRLPPRLDGHAQAIPRQHAGRHEQGARGHGRGAAAAIVCGDADEGCRAGHGWPRGSEK